MILCLSFERSMVDARTRAPSTSWSSAVLLLYLWRSLGQKTNAAGVLAHVMHPLRPSCRDWMSLATTWSLATSFDSALRVIFARQSPLVTRHSPLATSSKENFPSVPRFLSPGRPYSAPLQRLLELIVLYFDAKLSRTCR